MPRKKKQKESIKIEMHWDSSMIESTIYDVDEETLIVKFQSGGSYKYTGITNREYLEFTVADSQGKHFLEHIRNEKTCEKLEEKE